MKSKTQFETDGEFWADKLMDLANLSSIVLIFGQIAAIKIYWNIIYGGIIMYLLIVLVSFVLRRQKNELE